MTTILDALYNAQCNFKTISKMGASSNPIFTIALEQLNNAIAALEEGGKPDDELKS